MRRVWRRLSVDMVWASVLSCGVLVLRRVLCGDYARSGDGCDFGIRCDVGGEWVVRRSGGE